MHVYYHDIIDRLGEPIWWSEHAVPRYCKFAPEECDVYATEVVLLRIACQSCSKIFDVALSTDCYAKIHLSDRVSIKRLYYGDPPNMECCDTGIVETSIPLRVLEYWKMVDYKFVRMPEIEISLENE